MTSVQAEPYLLCQVLIGIFIIFQAVQLFVLEFYEVGEQ